MWVFWGGMQNFFREMAKKRSFKNFVWNMAPPASEGLDPLVAPAAPLGYAHVLELPLGLSNRYDPA